MKSLMRMPLLFGALLVPALVFMATGCSDSDSGTADEVSYDEYLRSFSFDYEPATSLADLAARSSVVTEARLEDVEDGAIFGNSPDDPDASLYVDLLFETDGGERYYVELPRPNYMSVEAVKSALPIGDTSIIYLQPNNDPRDELWFNVRQGDHWFFTTPQGWILDHPDRGVVTPLEDEESLGFDIPAGGTSDISAWLVDPKTPAS